jgi:hypothetical protein
MRKEKPSTTLVDFHNVERMYKERLKNKLAQEDYFDISQLVSAYLS